MTNILNLKNSLLDIGSKVDPGDGRLSLSTHVNTTFKKIEASLHRPLITFHGVDQLILRIHV